MSLLRSLVSALLSAAGADASRPEDLAPGLGLLDDGYQYWKLRGRRKDIVLVDCQQPFGNEYMLPRGTLGRQRITKLKVYKGDKHPHAAQSPKPLEIK